MSLNPAYDMAIAAKGMDVFPLLNRFRAVHNFDRQRSLDIGANDLCRMYTLQSTVVADSDCHNARRSKLCQPGWPIKQVPVTIF